MKSNSTPIRRGFTLVEILGVILIISILAALVTVGGRAAIRFFRGVNDKATIDNVAKALELYKNKYGEYPPDGTDMASVRRHLLKQKPDLTKKTVVDLLMEEIDRLRGVYRLVFHNDPIDNSDLTAIQKKGLEIFGRELAIDEIVSEDLPSVAESGELLTYWLCGEDWVLEGRKRWSALGLAWIEEVVPYIFQNGESEFIDLNPGFKNSSEVGTARTGINYNIAARALCDARGYPVVYFRANKTAKDGVVRWLHEGNESYEPIEYQNGESFYNEVRDVSNGGPAAGADFDPSNAGPFFTGLRVGNRDIFGLHPYRHCAEHSDTLWYAPDTYQLILPGEDGLYVPDPDDPTTFKAESDNVTNFCVGSTMAEEEFEGRHQENGE